MAGRPRPGSNETLGEIAYEERASGVPISIGLEVALSPPKLKPFTFDLMKALAELEAERPEGYKAFIGRSTPGKVGNTIGDLLRSEYAAKLQQRQQQRQQQQESEA